MTSGTLRIAVIGAALIVAVASLLTMLQSGAGRTGPAAGPRANSGLRPPFVVFRTLAPPEGHGRVAVLSLGVEDSGRQIAGLACLRLHYAGGRGLCVVRESADNPSSYVALAFDQSFTRGARFPLPGVPTRLRVAPNGRRAAITTYAEEERPEGERLATQSILVDLESGSVLADLREFHLDGGAFLPTPGAEPLDFSSVAFAADGDRFFATLTTPSERFLVAGSVHQRRLSLIRAGVASEALSPDGHHLAIKRLVGERGHWQLGVIDLRTWSARDLRQSSPSVDDQVEWWDARHVLYHDADGETTSIWVLPVDGESGPRVAIRDAYSAAVQR